MAIRSFAALLLLAILALAGCQSSPEVIPRAALTTTPTLAAQPAQANPLAPTAAPTFTPFFLPSPTAAPGSSQANTPEPGATPTVTLDMNGQTLELSVGQRFLLKLGDTYDWSPVVDDPAVVSRVPNITVVRGAQGVYEAHQAGTALLTATGDPLCLKATPPCKAPSILFKLKIVVK